MHPACHSMTEANEPGLPLIGTPPSQGDIAKDVSRAAGTTVPQRLPPQGGDIAGSAAADRCWQLLGVQVPAAHGHVVGPGSEPWGEGRPCG